MANIQERRDKSGKLISYSIRVFRGRGPDGKQLKPWTATFDVLPTWTEKSAQKKAEAFAATFERDCKNGTLTDTRQTFQEYSEYVLEMKEQCGLKHSTLVRYRELTARIYPAIGYLKLKDLRVDHLNGFYVALSKPGAGTSETRATAKIDLVSILSKENLTRVALAEKSGIPLRTVYTAVKGGQIREEAATSIARALDTRTSKLFSLEKKTSTLSPKTIIEYHRLISTVLEQALKESLVPFNVASRATLPKMTRRRVSYFQPEQIAEICSALDTEPLKWRALVSLLIFTGARRGEILGLKWENVNLDSCTIQICGNILYTADRGVYLDTPKTEESKRTLVIPSQTAVLLKQYKLWQIRERLRLGEYYDNQDFLFTQDDGKPMHPDSVNDWLNKFAKRHDLPHINPHAFRHSVASTLFYSGVDSVSISKQLGHAQVSTTANIYAHEIGSASQRNANVLTEAFRKKA